VYVKKRIEFSDAEKDQSVQETERIGMRLMKTKFDHWKYESEYRVFSALDDNSVLKEKIGSRYMHFLPFDLLFNLKEVILGPLYQSSNCEETTASLKALGVQTIKSTRPHSLNFALSRNRDATFRK
jgi:hypothetical protein